jgi:hypothetical protein
MSTNSKNNAERIEIHVPESDTRDLKLLDRSDMLFAVLYSTLFIWGLFFTLISI